MIVLGIETSCDDTAVGIVEDAFDPSARVRGHACAAQLKEHALYGGVVPEIAARAHLDKIDALLGAALSQAGVTLRELDGIAATCGPGLIGGVMVGAMTAKGISAVTGVPFCAVNHLEAHALTARLLDDVLFPYLLLLVSGGHSQLLLVEGVARYRRLGTTLDDAAGECFDKAAKLLGLGYPGGPRLESAARTGDPRAFSLPRPMLGRQGCDFSFSGLKTAVRQAVERAPKPFVETFVADMAASLQGAVADILADRTAHALDALAQEGKLVAHLVVAGGVAANETVRARLKDLAEARGLAFKAPPLTLCTDNGLMVAWAGLERLRLGFVDSLAVQARPRWPLEELS